MTDTQLLTLALAIIIPLSLLLYSNTRITEAKETLRAEIKLGATELHAEIEALRAEIKAGFERLETRLEA
jgi:hypothetical protein